MAAAGASPRFNNLRQTHRPRSSFVAVRSSDSLLSPPILRFPAAAAVVEGDVSSSERGINENECAKAPSEMRSPSFFPKKGQTLELVCESLAFKGKGVCKVADTGFVVMCDRALPGERFIGRVSRKKGNYAEVSVFLFLNLCFSLSLHF